MAEIISLPDVTLIAVTSVDIDETQFALQHSMQGIDFGAVKLLCPAMPSAPDPRILYQRIPPLDLAGYNRLLLRLLHTQFATSHCLIVQADGYVLAPERWEPAFLDYDYIGAPWDPDMDIIGFTTWKLRLDKSRVGNGGFSLRSKRLMQTVSRMPPHDLAFPATSEDVIVCHYLYDRLTAAGLTFAPLDVAARFALETEGAVPGPTIDTVFGFHGKHLFEKVEPILQQTRPCPCGSGKRFAACCGRVGP